MLITPRKSSPQRLSGRRMRSLEMAFAILCLAACTRSLSEESPDGGEDDTFDGSPPPPDADRSDAEDSTLPPVDGGLGPADLEETDPRSNGGTITFQEIGATGWYPSRRDPAVGPCDAYEADSCCLARREITSDQLTPWNEDLILTLRGPMRVRQLAVYQPDFGDPSRWSLVSGWDERAALNPQGLSFRGNSTESSGFDGSVGTECLVEVATNLPFACGAESLPYCPSGEHHWGWEGSKLFVLLAQMPHAGSPEAGIPCSDGDGGNWYDAPWIGLSLGELARAGAFSGCNCYARDPAQWWLGDGCGQFNVFEVVNDNNEYRNLDVFSTNFFGYGGYVGEGPCGAQCDVTGLEPEIDLIDKALNAEAETGAIASPSSGPGAAFRRPSGGDRYFLILLDEMSRTVQIAIIHPFRIPTAAAPLLPALPGAVSGETIQGLLELRLPR